MAPKRNVLGAMFDVRPIKESGVLDLEKATQPRENLNLRPVDTPKPVKASKISEDSFSYDATLTSLPETKKDIKPIKEITPKVFRSSNVERSDDELQAATAASISHKDKALQELENMIATPMNVTAEVVKFGGRVHFNNSKKAAPKTIEQFSDWLVDQEESRIKNQELGVENTSEINSKIEAEALKVQESEFPVEEAPSDIPPGSMQFDNSMFLSEASWRRPWPASGGDISKLRDYMAGGNAYHAIQNKPRKKFWKFNVERSADGFRAAKTASIVMAVAVIFVGFQFLSRSEIEIKNNVTQNGKNAVANLMDARENLLSFDFAAAANNFALANDDFSKAGSRLDKVGAVFASILKYIPGLNKIAAANNLIVAGQNISQAGGELSSALDDLGKIKLSSFINPKNDKDRQSLYEFLSALDNLLSSSQTKINRASNLLASVNESILPEDKQDLFVLFKDKLPELTEFFDKSDSYLNTLMTLVGEKGTKTYLVLLQNNTELRATGGFPGSYALISIQDGYIKEIKIDDSYNPDGQLKNNLIPPKPLQHITPTWGMRDANWFADFPTSAQKVIESYARSTSVAVDGVLTLTPDVITDILAIIGSIDMPDYGLTLNADNFLPEIQEEVEYGPDKADNRPKKILMEFQPKFMAKLGEQDKDNLAKISQVLMTAFQQKRILAYFLNKDAEELAITKNFGGELKNPKGDYLQVNISNIKGFKTDLVTKTAIDLNTKIDSQGTAEHELAITRVHNGGNLDQRFYNQPNPAYIRIYAPLGAEFELIIGNTWTTYEPLVDYSQSIFKSDPDLAAIEESVRNPVFAVDVFEESGKTVFGFWLVVNPGKTKTVTLKYKVPHTYTNNEYNLYVQKQSGTQGITFDATIHFPDGSKITSDFPSDLKSSQNSATLTTNLDLDIPIEITTQP